MHFGEERGTWAAKTQSLLFRALAWTEDPDQADTTETWIWLPQFSSDCPTYKAISFSAVRISPSHCDFWNANFVLQYWNEITCSFRVNRKKKKPTNKRKNKTRKKASNTTTSSRPKGREQNCLVNFSTMSFQHNLLEGFKGFFCFVLLLCVLCFVLYPSLAFKPRIIKILFCFELPFLAIDWSASWRCRVWEIDRNSQVFNWKGRKECKKEFSFIAVLLN